MNIQRRSQDGFHCCRHCSEPETLANVLGSCALLRITDTTMLSGPLLLKLWNWKGGRSCSIKRMGGPTKWQVLAEIHCIAKGGSTHWWDILAYDEFTYNHIGFEILINQPQDVNTEIQNLYEPCVVFVTHCNPKIYKLDPIAVIG